MAIGSWGRFLWNWVWELTGNVSLTLTPGASHYALYPNYMGTISVELVPNSFVVVDWANYTGTVAIQIIPGSEASYELYYSGPLPSGLYAWVDEGENRSANILLGVTSPDSNTYLGIFSNNLTIAETLTLASFTEPSTGGYARKALARGSWVIGADYAEYYVQTFYPSSGSWTIYGCFLGTSIDGSGKLLFAERLTGAPWTISQQSPLKLSPRITFR